VAMQDIDPVKEIMDQYNIKPGSYAFKDMAEIMFYPQYA
jgi:hypothetical protein